MAAFVCRPFVCGVASHSSGALAAMCFTYTTLHYDNYRQTMAWYKIPIVSGKCTSPSPVNNGHNFSNIYQFQGCLWLLYVTIFKVVLLFVANIIRCSLAAQIFHCGFGFGCATLCASACLARDCLIASLIAFILPVIIEINATFSAFFGIAFGQLQDANCNLKKLPTNPHQIPTNALQKDQTAKLQYSFAIEWYTALQYHFPAYWQTKFWLSPNPFNGANTFRSIFFSPRHSLSKT